MKTMECNGLGLSKTCHVYLPAISTSTFSYDNFFYDKYTCSKAGMLAFEQVYFSY